jgi:hypothetical protein
MERRGRSPSARSTTATIPAIRVLFQDTFSNSRTRFAKNDSLTASNGKSCSSNDSATASNDAFTASNGVGTASSGIGVSYFGTKCASNGAGSGCGWRSMGWWTALIPAFSPRRRRLRIQPNCYPKILRWIASGLTDSAGRCAADLPLLGGENPPNFVRAWRPVTGSGSDVAQTGSLLCRRLATGGPADCQSAKQQVANLRYVEVTGQGAR